MLARQLYMLLTVLTIALSAVSAHSRNEAIRTASYHPSERCDGIHVGPAELHNGVNGSTAVPCPVPRTASSQQDSQQSTRHLTQTRDSSKDGTAATAASSASAHDHKPLFPISGLEVAVLVIAGVVLFIAAGVLSGYPSVILQLSNGSVCVLLQHHVDACQSFPPMSTCVQRWTVAEHVMYPTLVFNLCPTLDRSRKHMT
jgi:hypothetical protein